jgi:hypothetical protein
MICDAEEQLSLPTTLAAKSDFDSDAVVLALADSKPAVIAAAVSSDDSGAWPTFPEVCGLESMLDLSLIDMPPQRINLIPLLTMQPAGQEMLEEVGVMIGGIGSGSVDLSSYARRKLLPDFGTTYRALARRVALAGLRRIQDESALAQTTVMGTVSTYNPFRGGKLEGGPETASGEIYDPTAWTAALKPSCAIGFAACAMAGSINPFLRWWKAVTSS